MKRAFALPSIVVLAGAIGLAQSRPVSQSTLQGVWRVTAVTTTGPNASTNNQPQPGLYIFTAKHYSIVRVSAAKPRPDVPADIEKATADELRAAWDPFAANAGTYEVAGGNLTTRPMVAKNPGVMKTGSFTVSSFKVEGNTLSVTESRNQDGPIANPTTRKLTRIE
jgi:hypothetical protein